MDDLIDTFQYLLARAIEPQVLIQLATIAACAVAGWLLVWLGRERIERSMASTREQTGRSPIRINTLGNVLWPLVASLLAVVAERASELRHQPTAVLRLGILVLFASGAIRFVLYAVRRVFRPSGLLGLMQRAFTFVAWMIVVLHITGLLPDITDALASVPVYQMHGTSEEINLLQILQGAFWVALTLVIALWGGAALEGRLMRMSSLDGSLQVAMGRFARAFLVVIAVLVSMQVVGIPLGVLGVFGGALGVGLGLGLQRVASNYVSGFIILLDRSLRIGDLIAVDKYTGSVTQIRTRYTVVKALDGTEAILPNELLVNSPVLNHSYTSRQTRIGIKLQVGYDSDVNEAMELMVAAARGQPRVLEDPPPVAIALGFAADGLDLELGFWVADAELGTGGIRSEINLAILAAFRASGVAIPNPKRDLRVEMLSGGAEAR
jgi:small-conductance mechanosensitive channel